MNVLLLAFSGLRIVDAELAQLGLTLPGFADRARVIAALPSLGLLTLAAHAQAGAHFVYRERDELPSDVDAAADRLVGERFELVLISSLSAVVREAYALADALRARGVRVVLGGLHVSALPHEAAAHADALVIGAGEAVIAHLLDDARRGELAPLYRATAKAARNAERSSTPPRWDLLGERRYDRMTVRTMRGCPLDCTFCGASRTYAPFSNRPLSAIEADLDAALARAPRRRIELADDNTFAARRDAHALVALLARRGARWFTETDLSLADDPDLIDRIADSGCVGLLVGLESPRAARLKSIDSRGAKARWADEQHTRIARIQERGVPVTGCFVVGLDTQDADVFEETARAVRELELAEVQVTLATPFPATAWRAQLEREQRIDARDTWDRLTLFDVAFEPAHMSRAALENGFKALVRELYSDEEVTRRRAHAFSLRRAVRRGLSS